MKYENMSDEELEKIIQGCVECGDAAGGYAAEAFRRYASKKMALEICQRRHGEYVEVTRKHLVLVLDDYNNKKKEAEEWKNEYDNLMKQVDASQPF